MSQMISLRTSLDNWAAVPPCRPTRRLMLRRRLSDAAQADVIDIPAWTQEQFGEITSRPHSDPKSENQARPRADALQRHPASSTITNAW
jgi:hypothetical protein